MAHSEFETIMILDPHLTKEQCRVIIDDYKAIINKLLHTSRIKYDFLGKKKLSYAIKSCTEGWYILFTYNTEDVVHKYISELEAKLRSDDRILKFLTVKCEPKEDDNDDVLNDLDINQSEQPDYKNKNKNKNIDAMDVLLGFANYV